MVISSSFDAGGRSIAVLLAEKLIEVGSLLSDFLALRPGETRQTTNTKFRIPPDLTGSAGAVSNAPIEDRTFLQQGPVEIAEFFDVDFGVLERPRYVGQIMHLALNAIGLNSQDNAFPLLQWPVAFVGKTDREFTPANRLCNTGLNVACGRLGFTNTRRPEIIGCNVTD